MITVTDKARAMVLSFMNEGDEPPQALRVGLEDGSPIAPKFALSLVGEAEIAPDDTVVDVDGLRVVVPSGALESVEGATIDFVERLTESGFEVVPARPSPGASTPSREAPSGPLADRVRAILDERVNPAIASHGGSIHLVAVEDTELYIEMSGGCQGCAMSRMTLRQGVERMIRDELPEVTAVHDATDHSSGENPYFR